MDKLTDEEKLRSDMMLETVHEVFAGMVMPAFMTIIEFHQQNIRGEIGDGEPRDKQCETFHDKVREMTKGKLEPNGLFDDTSQFYRLTVFNSRKMGLNVGFVSS